MAAIITLTTDFGLTDAYVAEVKGVILGINPGAKIVDICHAIKPQDISQAAFVLSTAYKFFPRKTVHVVVVDPEVGSERRAIILRTPQADFVAPDNGVLSYVIQESRAAPVDNNTGCRQVELEPGLQAVAITRSQFWRSPVSPTFHGRDIFAPVAARLSLGFPPVDFGEEVTSVRVLPLSRPCQAPDGALVGHVIHVDGFGNLITDIRDDDLPLAREAVIIDVGNRRILGLSRTYAEGEGLLALIGGSGYLEISVKEGNASTFLDAGIGDEVKVDTAHKD